MIQYIQCNLPVPLHTACLEKEHSMQDKAERGHPAALLQSPSAAGGTDTCIFLFASAAGTVLFASLSHFCGGVFTCVCVSVGTPEVGLSSHLSALHSPSLIYPHQLPTPQLP